MNYGEKKKQFNFFLLFCNIFLTNCIIQYDKILMESGRGWVIFRRLTYYWKLPIKFDPFGIIFLNEKKLIIAE